MSSTPTPSLGSHRGGLRASPSLAVEASCHSRCVGQVGKQDHSDHLTSGLGRDIGMACGQVPSGRFEFRLVAGGGMAMSLMHTFGFIDTLTTGEEEKAARCGVSVSGSKGTFFKRFKKKQNQHQCCKDFPRSHTYPESPGRSTGSALTIELNKRGSQGRRAHLLAQHLAQHLAQPSPAQPSGPQP